MQIRAQCRSLCQPNPGKSFPILSEFVLSEFDFGCSLVFHLPCRPESGPELSQQKHGRAESRGGGCGTGRAPGGHQQHDAGAHEHRHQRAEETVLAHQTETTAAGRAPVHPHRYRSSFWAFYSCSEFRKWQKGKYVVLVSMLWHFSQDLEWKLKRLNLIKPVNSRSTTLVLIFMGQLWFHYR